MNRISFEFRSIETGRVIGGRTMSWIVQKDMLKVYEVIEIQGRAYVLTKQHFTTAVQGLGHVTKFDEKPSSTQILGRDSGSYHYFITHASFVADPGGRELSVKMNVQDLQEQKVVSVPVKLDAD